MEGQPLVLVVDDDRNVTRLLELYLERAGFRVLAAYNGEEALEACREDCPDLVVLDIMLPRLDGWEVCRRLRAENEEIPVIFLTARDAPADRVAGLDMGGDDYVVKPFDPHEVVARVNARLRRRPRGSTLKVENLAVDLTSFEVKVDGRLVGLKPREVHLLHFLAVHPNQVFSREKLLEKVWGYDYMGETRTVDVHVQRLREKVGAGNTWKIKTVWGVGYKFEVQKDAP